VKGDKNKCHYKIILMKNTIRNKYNKKGLFTLLSIFILSTSFIVSQTKRPTLYLIGDSTVRNTNKEQWGWGTLLPDYFDTSKIKIDNQAQAGRSTRTYVKEGRWDRVMSTLQKGDYVMMQFGHNDGAKPDISKGGYRGVIRGTVEDTVELTWKDGSKEIVHSYGWYIKKFVRDAKAKGATPIVLSMIPRNIWKDGKVPRANNDFGKWAREVAEQEHVQFIDLNAITADKYDQWGADKVKEFFPGDHTHTNKAGADVNAQSIVDGIRKNPAIELNKYLLNK
jgi:rhamnogalacturonan acetylesterase